MILVLSQFPEKLKEIFFFYIILPSIKAYNMCLVFGYLRWCISLDQDVY